MVDVNGHLHFDNWDNDLIDTRMIKTKENKYVVRIEPISISHQINCKYKGREINRTNM